jgi:hypothetical protein
MTREDFRIVPKYYSTNNLTYILYNDKVIGYVEVFDDLFFKEIEKDKWESQKKKRKQPDVERDCEAVIRRYIKENS